MDGRSFFLSVFLVKPIEHARCVSDFFLFYLLDLVGEKIRVGLDWVEFFPLVLLRSESAWRREHCFGRKRGRS
jgi:hypothetical protein